MTDSARGNSGESHAAATALRLGVWRRGPSDWAYRIEVEGYGSVAGVGFASRDEARYAMQDARLDALARLGARRVEEAEQRLEVTLVDRGCPVCGAPPGDFCHTPSGKPRSDHAGREYEQDGDALDEAIYNQTGRHPADG